MPQITDIKPQRKLRSGEPRFNIFLDGKYGFALPAETLVKEDLKIGQQLSSEQTVKLVKLDQFAKYYNLALKLISARPRSEKEIDDWFKKKEVGEETQKLIKKKLKAIGFLNDEEFVRWWIEQRQTFRQMGKRAIEMELRQKGIDKETIATLLHCYIATTTELELAKKAVEKKIRYWEKLPKEEFEKKVIAFLSRRGFDWETIKEAVDETIKKE